MATSRIAKSRLITPEVGEASGHRIAVVTKRPLAKADANAMAPRTSVLTRKYAVNDDLQRKVQALIKTVEHQQILIKTMMGMIENHSNALVKLGNKCSELAAKAAE